ncbi:MAG: restriction endonuclease subunit S [Pseudobdellovibrionaceae bacterium]
MGKWRKCKIGDVAFSNVRSVGKDYQYKDILYLDTGSITRGRIEEVQEFSLVDAPSRAKRLVQDQDIIYSTVRPIQRHYGFIRTPPKNLVVSTGFSVITAKKEEAEPLYLYYLLTSDERVEELDVIAEASTSAYPSLRPADIEALDIEIPKSTKEQAAIAEVLCSLDDKIDLLHRQNKTLESIAETLFRQWFIEEEQKYTKLGLVIETTSGGTPSRSNMGFYEDGTHYWVKSKELNGKFILDTEEKITDEAVKKSSAKILPAYSVLIAMYGATVGEYALISKPMTCNQAICAVLPNERYPYTFLFMFIKSMKDKIMSMAVGSAQQNVSQILIKQLDIPEACPKIIEFSNLVAPLFEKIENNLLQTLKLERLHDNLLPKLMSGEVRVQYQEAV